ncbi:hypothetical protein AB6A40_007508 [Gnathostoma spinigerum]|uniref:Uncharacterized protein n=1 Tax=Gnathostoma spinigerum TaxID=75299 RepID=A0ABD6ERJ8_9BILA
MGTSQNWPPITFPVGNPPSSWSYWNRGNPWKAHYGYADTVNRQKMNLPEKSLPDASTTVASSSDHITNRTFLDAFKRLILGIDEGIQNAGGNHISTVANKLETLWNEIKSGRYDDPIDGVISQAKNISRMQYP